MVRTDEKSNAQSWELEIVCKNKKYLEAVVAAILKYGMLSFEVENIEFHSNGKDYEGRYLVFIWCNWFINLNMLTTDLMKIEEKLK